MTDIYFAASHADIVTVKKALDEGFDINARNDNPGEDSLLGLAAQDGNLELVNLLVETGADIEVENYFEETPLHAAVVHNHPEVAEFLIDAGADFRRKFDTEWSSLLHVAALHGSVDVAELLIANGLDVTETDDEGWTPLHIAAFWNKRPIADLLMKHGASIDMWVAAGLCNLEMANTLIMAGQTVDSRDESGETPLFEMVRFNREDAVEFLISLGADVNARESDHKKTPLFAAASDWHLSVTRVLVDHGADVNVRCYDGRTPLHYTSFPRADKVAALLIVKGADVNAVDDRGSTPLHSAARDDAANVAELLLSAGADPNIKDKKGKTPLDIAVAPKSKKVARLLRLEQEKEYLTYIPQVLNPAAGKAISSPPPPE